MSGMLNDTQVKVFWQSLDRAEQRDKDLEAQKQVAHKRLLKRIAAARKLQAEGRLPSDVSAEFSRRFPKSARGRGAGDAFAAFEEDDDLDVTTDDLDVTTDDTDE